MHPDKVSLAFGIKIDPHNHKPFTIPMSRGGCRQTNRQSPKGSNTKGLITNKQGTGRRNTG